MAFISSVPFLTGWHCTLRPNTEGWQSKTLLLEVGTGNPSGWQKCWCEALVIVGCL
jgi:hypothetical protein